MGIRGSVRPSKPLSVVGVIIGIVLIGIGFFLAIPHAGLFGVFWVLVVLFFTGYHAMNLFSKDGVAHGVVEVDTTPCGQSEESIATPASIENRLKRA